MEPRQTRKVVGRLSYCLVCKDDTETVIVREPGLLWPLAAKRRFCRKCAQPKAQSELEMEKGYR